MSWTTEQIEKLIEGYIDYPQLYAIKHPEYHNKNKRQLALNNVLKAIDRPGTTILEIQKKWNGLRSTYINEKKKVLESVRSGSGEDEVYKPKLWYFKKLEFLHDHISMRQASSSFDPFSEKTDLSIESQGSPHIQEAEEEHCYAMHDDGILSPASSSTPVPSPQTDMRTSKKKKANVDYQEALQQQASAALISISQAASGLSSDKNEETDDELYGKYVTKRLENIKTLKRKFEVKHNIDQLLFEAQIAELENKM